jgi:hypothetical protein
VSCGKNYSVIYIYIYIYIYRNPMLLRICRYEHFCLIEANSPTITQHHAAKYFASGNTSIVYNDYLRDVDALLEFSEVQMHGSLGKSPVSNNSSLI